MAGKMKQENEIIKKKKMRKKKLRNYDYRITIQQKLKRKINKFVFFFDK